MNGILDIIKNPYIIIGFIVIIFIILTIIVTKIIIKNRKNKKMEIEEEKINNEKNECINLYNQLIYVFESHNRTTDLNKNNVLAYYHSLLTNTDNDFEYYYNLKNNLQIQINNSLYEFENEKQKEELREQKRYFFNQCSMKLLELQSLYNVLNIENKTIINNFNNKLLNENYFIEIDEYKIIYNEIEKNIEYIKEKYKDELDKLKNSNKHSTKNSNNNVNVDKNKEIKNKIKYNKDDLKLINYLKVLNCESDEIDFEKIKKNYIYLIKKYHPDLNKDSVDSIKKTSEINAAYNYIKFLLEEKE